jgi:TonB family protein
MIIGGKERAVFGWLLSALVHGGLAAMVFWLPEQIIPRRLAAIEMVDRKPPKPKPKVEIKKPPPKPKEKPKPPEVLKNPIKVKKLPPKRVLRSKKRRPKPPPPKGDPNAKEPAAKDTGPKTFGIDMSSTTAAPGTGVKVPRGQSLGVDPQIRKVGKGQPKGQRGFKKDYKVGEAAPVAVVTSMPKLRKRVQPKYPPRMRDLGIEGRVVLNLTVDAKGRVTKAKLMRGLHKELDKAALAAAYKLVFSPAMVNKTAVSVQIPFTFSFVLD